MTVGKAVCAERGIQVSNTHIYRAIVALVILCGSVHADAESDAVLALVLPSDAEFTAVQDGNWSDPATWDHGVPAHGDVWIPPGMTVTLDCDTPGLRSLRVDGAFDANENTTLKVDTVVVSHMGTWVICLDDVTGTHRVQFVDDPTLSDPRQLSLGFVAMGHVSMNGVRKTEAVRFTQTDASTLQMLDAPEHWVAGDTVVVAGAKYGQHEVRTIAAIDGYTLTLNAPLTHSHVAPEGLFIHVANYTRNVRFESAAPGAVATRGHCMFMHNPEQSVSGVGFVNLGRTDKSKVLNSATLDGSGNLVAGTNQVGRYPFHLHRSGVQAGVGTVEVGHCCVFNDPAYTFQPGWGMAHHSSKAVIEHCASFNVFGSHYVSEAGNECGSWRHNIAIHTGGTLLRPDTGDRLDKFQDHAHSGSGFWLTGGGVEVEDCVAANCKFSGVTMVAVGLKENGVTTEYDRHNLRDPSILPLAKIQVRHVPFRVVGLESYGGGHGFDAWQAKLIAGQSRVENLHAWNCTRDPYFISYCNRVHAVNLQLLGGTGHLATDRNNGLSGSGASSNVGATDLFYINADIRGFQNGILVPLSTGLKADISGGRLDNGINVLVDDKVNADDSGRICHINGVQFAPGAEWNVYLREDWVPRPVTYIPKYLFTPDVLTLDGVQLYWQVQSFDFVPFPTGAVPTGTPAELIDKTQAQLAEMGKAIYGKSVVGIPWPGTNAIVEGDCQQQIQRLLERIRELEN
jgi:hypothetical protein